MSRITQDAEPLSAEELARENREWKEAEESSRIARERAAGTYPEVEAKVEGDISAPTDPYAAPGRNKVALNLAAYASFSQDIREKLIWFHQHVLDQGHTIADAGQLIQYESSVVYRVFNGKYPGSIEKFADAIESYRKLWEERKDVAKHGFAENRTSKLIFSALSYAHANNSIALITGESGMGKTECAKAWRDRNNHGTTVFVTAPIGCHLSGFVRTVAKACGLNAKSTRDEMTDGVYRAFNRQRMLIVDEVGRLLPTSKSATPLALEYLRDLHDQTGCGLALLATARFGESMERSEYQFEQLLRRVGQPIRLYRKATADDVKPILVQYISTPSDAVMASAIEIANARGRLGRLVEICKVASKIAK